MTKRFERLKKVDAREEIWTSVYRIAKKNFMFGVGTGDVKNELVLDYIARDFKGGIQHKFGAHNQYFEVLLAVGVIGLILFGASILVPLYFAVQEKKYLYIVFLSLFSLLCLTENIIEKQEGILWYAFLNSFFASQLFFVKQIKFRNSV